MATRIVSIVGQKNAGKTTLTVALATEFKRKRRRVMTIKHGHHPAEVDQKGTDTWRHFVEAGAERTLIAAPEMRVLFERTKDDYDPIGLARRYMDGADLVLCEGFKHARLPKVEIARKAAGPPLYEPGSEHAGEHLAIVTDDRDYEATLGRENTVPVLHFHDTMWLQLLTALIWEKALVLEP
ncbi:MAG: molybdopterin-guanine dinucleotide biosynthesis protein B [Gemmatimonadales bacterium]|nr:molybdopterin-guanine dinucleotide biosynthesis protein B [Gemmatimonadales bacterium]